MRPATFNNRKKGYILLLSVLVSSIILSISFGVYALSIKEIILASFLKDSAMALGAADRAVECTLYWDRAYPQDGFTYSIFSTSTKYVSQLGGPTIPYCDNVNISDNTQTGWLQINNPGDPSFPDTGNTTFTLNYPDNTCADVSVYKESISTTTIIANGYNMPCDASSLTNPRRTQRTIQVQGNF